MLSTSKETSYFAPFASLQTGGTLSFIHCLEHSLGQARDYILFDGLFFFAIVFGEVGSGGDGDAGVEQDLTNARQALHTH